MFNLINNFGWKFMIKVCRQVFEILKEFGECRGFHTQFENFFKESHVFWNLESILILWKWWRNFSCSNYQVRLFSNSLKRVSSKFNYYFINSSLNMVIMNTCASDRIPMKMTNTWIKNKPVLTKTVSQIPWELVYFFPDS